MTVERQTRSNGPDDPLFPSGVRVRLWVSSLPFDVRCRAAFDHELGLAITSIAARAIDARYRRLARTRAGASRAGAR